jgi:hypothetical protein
MAPVRAAMASVGLGKRRGDWLFDQQMLPALQGRSRDVVMGGGRHRDGCTVRLVEQRFQRPEGPNAKLGRHLSRAIRSSVEQSH